MKTATVVLAALASWHVPVHARHISVSMHGRQLVELADPAYDTCSNQSSFVRSRRDKRIVAEFVRCWNPSSIDNYTHSKLIIRYEVKR